MNVNVCLCVISDTPLHTRDTGHTGARGHPDHTDEPHNHPPKQTQRHTRTTTQRAKPRPTQQPQERPQARTPESTAPRGRYGVSVTVSTGTVRSVFHGPATFCTIVSKFRYVSQSLDTGDWHRSPIGKCLCACEREVCLGRAFVGSCFACGCVLELVVCRVRFARVSCPRLRFRIRGTCVQ